MRRALKWIGWTVAVASGLVVLLVAVVLVGANTRVGRDLIVSQMPKLTGGAIEIAGLSGRFPVALRLDRMEIRDKDGAWLTIEDLALDWHPLRLLTRKADIERLAAERVAVARLPISSQTEQPKPTATSSYSLPISVQLGTLRIARLELAAPVAGSPAALALDGSAHVVSLEQADASLAIQRLDGPGTYALQARIDPSALRVRLTASEPAQGPLSGLAGLPELGALSVDATLDGPRDAIGTRLSVEAGSLRATAGGTVDLVREAADLTVSARSPAMNPRPNLAWQSVALDAHVSGPFTTPRASGTLDITSLSASGAAIRQLAARVGGDGAGQVTLHMQAEGIRVPGRNPNLLAAGAITLDASARMDAPERPVDFTIKHPLIDAEGRAQTARQMRADVVLRLPDLGPLAAAAGTDIRGRTALNIGVAQQDGTTTVMVDGALAVTGGMAPLPGLIGDDGTLGVSVSFRGQDVAVSRLALDGKTLSLSAEGGLHDDKVELSWRTALSDLAVLAPAVAGRLTSQGRVAGPKDDLAVTADLSGDVASRGRAPGPITAKLAAEHLPNVPLGELTAQGQFEGSPIDLAITLQTDQAGAAHVDIGRAEWKSAHAKGALTLPKGARFPVGQLDLRMTQLADLRSLTGHPLSGSVAAGLETIERDGHQTARLQAEVHDAGLAGSASVGRVILNAAVTDPNGKPTVKAKLTADTVSASGMTGSAKLELAGPEDALAVRLAAAVQDLRGAPLDLTGAATVNAPAEQVTLSALQADWKDQALRLLSPARIGFRNAVTVDRLRLGIQEGTLEVSGRASPTLDLAVAVRNVTPELARVVEPSVDADGVLRADAKLTGTTAWPTGTVRLEATGVRMRTGPGRTLPPADLVATADLAGDDAQIDTRLTAGQLTRVTVTGRAPIRASGVLDLRTNGTLDLALLDPIMSASGRRVRGRMALNAGVAGSLSAPRVNGTAQLTGGEVQDFAQGAHISDIAALVQADGDTIRITQFTGRGGDGTIGLTGTVGIRAPGLPVNLRLTANDAKPLAGDRLEVTLSGDLTLQGEMAEQLQLGGTVQISRAEIRIPEHMPAGVAVLEVRNPGEAPPPPPAPPPNIALNLTIAAPNEIFVRGRGMFAEVGGTVHVRGTAAKPEPDGGFQMIRGTISLAGTTLTFTKGEVSFTGGALTDPSIDFVATSSNGSITANLEVTGSASDPKITLFSTPELPQDEVLAQLLFKSSTSSLTPFQVAEIAAALAELTGVTSSAGNPLDSIRRGLGLDTLSVGGTTSGPTLEAGRYVTPRVFVGAKQGTSGTSTQGLVQVDITKGLKLQGTAGTGTNTNPGATPDESAGSSIGLKYQFEY
jgi:translocation and assembly module TamB